MCRTAQIIAYHKRNPEKTAAAHAKYIRTEKGKEMSARHREKHREKRRETIRRWHENNPHKDRNYALVKRYGITLDEYEAMFAAQNGVCAICKQPEMTFRGKGKNPNRPKVMAVDHCHDTGKVRGLLCYTCNLMIGSSRNSVDILQTAIQYLKEYNGV